MLLLDEPLSALDAKVRAQLRDEIRRIQLEVGTTTLFVTHDQEEALAVADRVGVMRSAASSSSAAAGRAVRAPADRVRRRLRRPDQPAARPRVEGGTAHVLGGSVPLLPGSATGAGDRAGAPRGAARRARGPDGTASVVSASFLGALGRVTVRTDGGETVIAQIANTAVTGFSPGDRGDHHPPPGRRAGRLGRLTQHGSRSADPPR